MSEQADLDELARRYLDLWQDQMSALAADRDFAAALQQLTTTMGLTAAGAWAAWPAMTAGLTPGPRGGPSADGRSRDLARGAEAATGTTTGAASAAASPDGGLARLDELARRLAALEERIAALEARTAGGGGRASSGSRKHRS